MESDILKIAKKLFYNYYGYKWEMMRDEVIDEYLRYKVPRDIELEWINDIFNKQFSKMDINNIDSLISISLIIDVHLQVLIDKLYRIEKYIIENLNNCVDTTGIEILVDAILRDLYKISKIDVRQEIAAFKKLKRKI